MRPNRSLILWPESANVHLFWRCHNREFYLKDSNFKNLYMHCIGESLAYKKQGDNCQMHAYCVMDNHFHQSITYKNGSASLSKFMRYAHGLFGARYNRLNERSGKVAEGRPKTPRVQDDDHAMRLHFYIEANPIRAQTHTLENLKDFIYSSYGFYAYGKQTKFTPLLTVPQWYLNLGKTKGERQRKYRKLFKDYLEKEGDLDLGSFMKYAIGNDLWVENFIIEIRDRMATEGSTNQNNTPPVPSG